MIRINVKADFGEVDKVLSTLKRQMPFAIASALTKTAAGVQRQTRIEMRQRLDRPTPFAINSVQMKKATKEKLQSEVYVNDQPQDKSPLSPVAMFGQQFTAGGRNQKRLEKLLQRAGYLGAGEFIVPGKAAKLDRYGNMSRGQISQIVSQLKASTGGLSDSSNSKRSRAKRVKNRIFWHRGGHGMPRGAYIDQGPGIGIRPLLIAIRAPSYRQRIDLERVARQVVEKDWDRNFAASIRQAMATAKP